jgi:hypothetical protein
MGDIVTVLLVQCKCWRTTKPITSSIIREMIGAKQAYCKRTAIDGKWVNTAIVTTSYYTKGYVEVAK